MAYLTIGAGVPFALGVSWTLYSDWIKSYNLVGQELTLRFRFSNRYVGTLAQRFDLQGLHEIFWNRIIAQNGGGVLGAVLLSGGLLSGTQRIRSVIAVCLALMVCPVMLFYDVNLFLEYYQVPFVVFLPAALAVCCVVWLPRVIGWRGAVPLTVSVLVLINLSIFWSRYGQTVSADLTPSNTRGLAVGTVIQRYTPEDSGILVFGLHEGLSSFCPEIPYLSHRKGLTVPDWKEQTVASNPASYLGGRRLGAMVFCSTVNKQRYNRLIKEYSRSAVPGVFGVSDCHVWLPNTPMITLADGVSVLPTESLE